MNLLVNLTQYGYGSTAEHASLKWDEGHGAVLVVKA
jgi:hypothetical protein